MDEASIEGALALATYAMSLYTFAFSTGELTEWKALSHPECVFCASVVSNVESMLEKGHHNEGGQVQITDSSVTEIDPGRSFGVDLEVTQESFITVDSSGAQIGDPALVEEMRVAFYFLYENGTWRIRAVETLDSDV